MHDVVLLVLPKWNVYVMTAEMALSPNQNSCCRRSDSNFPNGLCSATANESRARLQMASMKRMVYSSMHTIAMSLPSLQLSLLHRASGSPLSARGPK